MTSDEIDRRLVELGERHRSGDVSSVMERFRKRLDHLAGEPSGWDRIDELAARVIECEPRPVAVPEDAPEPAGQRGARPSRDRRSEMLDGTEALVRVLGDVVATRVAAPSRDDAMVPSHERGLEVISYLALREVPVDRNDLEKSLFPAGATAKTVDNAIRSARELLGDELFPPPEGGRYQLSPAVVTDYEVFRKLVVEAEATEDALEAADLLDQALSFVRGEPFTGAGRTYSWAGPYRRVIATEVVDAAEGLAEVRLASGDWRSAERAARQGLRAFPSDERMYRVLMRSARAAGNIAGVQRTFRELCDVLADADAALGVAPEDTADSETIALLEELTGSTRST